MYASIFSWAGFVDLGFGFWALGVWGLVFGLCGSGFWGSGLWFVDFGGLGLDFRALWFLALGVWALWI